MAKLELHVTVYTSEKYDIEAAENARARLKNDRIKPTFAKFAEQVLDVLGGMGYVESASDCRGLQEVGAQKREPTPLGVVLPEKKAAQ